jgi:trans-aconitate methyltransferase
MDSWSSGTAYEQYIGRWSRRVAPEFLTWLDAGPGRRWLDVGCGTGALTSAILAGHDPASVLGVDPSATFLAQARATVTDRRAQFVLGDASTTGLGRGAVDVAVAGLVMNFIPDLALALAAIRDLLAPGGWIGGYVWDYADGMQMIRHFWDAAVALDPMAANLDEGLRFPITAPGPLQAAFRAAGLDDVEVRAIEIPTVFPSFDDFWLPFLSGTAPAPAYAISLSDDARVRLRERLRSDVPSRPDGSIQLIARAWAVRGRVRDDRTLAAV